MNNDSLYIKNVRSRNTKQYYIGVIARLKNYIKNYYSIKIARKNGAIIGTNVSLPIKLSKIANSNLKVGNNSSIQTHKLDMRSPITIGNNVIIGSGVEIITCSHNVDSPEWEHKSYGIIIEDYSWIATNVLILPSCRKIGYGAVVSSGSVVSKNIEEMNIMSGNPAEFLRKRKIVHSNLCVESLLGNDLLTYIKVRKKFKNSKIK